MPRNIEIKTRIASVAALLPRARALADGDAELIEQDDTFFNVPQGRLKLREFADGSAELIHYQRADTPGARASDYLRLPVAQAAAMRQLLARGLGIQSRVRKRRFLLLAGQTRMHLDDVQELGTFLELEVVLGDGQSDAEGHEIAERVMAELDLAMAPRLGGAYLDLLRDQ